jgi:hypothetical protein
MKQYWKRMRLENLIYQMLYYYKLILISSLMLVQGQTNEPADYTYAVTWLYNKEFIVIH